MAVFSKYRNILSISKTASKYSTKSTRLASIQRGHLKLEKNAFKKNEHSRKYFSKILVTQIRSQQTNANNNEELTQKPLIKTSFLYSLSVAMGGIFGVLTGYWLMTDESQIENDNESIRATNVYESTKVVSILDDF